MAGLPPQISTDPGTPSSEWAKSTTTAAFSRTDPAPAMSQQSADPTDVKPTPVGGTSISATDTANKGPFDPRLVPEGEGVPGAYPVTPGDTNPDTQLSVKDTAARAAEVASQMASTAATTAAAYLPKGVVDTVSSYIPTSHATSTMTTARASEHDAEHKTSLPTTEYGGAGTGEHVGGVGSLPGPMNEPGVAKLPQENTDEERYATAGTAAAALASTAYALKDAVLGGGQSAAQTAQQTAQQAAGTVQGTAQQVANTAKQYVPGTQHSTAVTASTLPTHEFMGAQPGDHSLGAGALPGDQDEPHVARLPEESIHPQYDSGNIDTAAQVSMKPSEEEHGNEASIGDVRHVGGVGALVGDRSEQSVARLPDDREGATGQAAYHETGARGDPGAGLTGPTGAAGAGALVPTHDAESKQGAKDSQASQAATGAAGAAETKPKDEGEKKEEGKKASGASGHKGQPNKGPGYDTDYHPADLHPREETKGHPESQAAEGEKSLGATQADANRPPEEQKPPHTQDTQTQRKATFMEKMKGEAKVLLGKIEGKHDKVVEGQRMKHPTTAEAPNAPPAPSKKSDAKA